MFTILSYLHDLYFLAAAASMDGHYATAREAANKLVDQVAPHVKEMPPLQAFLTVQPAVLVRFSSLGRDFETASAECKSQNRDLNVAFCPRHGIRRDRETYRGGSRASSRDGRFGEYCRRMNSLPCRSTKPATF